MAQRRRRRRAPSAERVRRRAVESGRQRDRLGVERRERGDVVPAEHQCPRWLKHCVRSGQGDAERNRIFAEAFGKDIDFFSFYRSMQAYEAGMRHGDTRMVLNPDSEFFRYFVDPSGKGRDGSNARSSVPSPSVPTPPVPAPAR